jgi:glutathione S-transferase
MSRAEFVYSQSNADHILLYDALGSPCARRVRITLLEKEKPWDSIWIDLSTLQQRHPDYLAINPNGFVPSLAHGTRIIYESGVITQYLDDLYPDYPLYPADPDDLAAVKSWQAAELAMAKDYRTIMYARMMGPIVRMTRSLDEAHTITKRSTTSEWDVLWEEKVWRLQVLTAEQEQDYEDRLYKWLDSVEQALTGKTYLVGGKFSQAEIAVYPRVDMYSYVGLNITAARYPNVTRWRKMLAQRSSFKQSMTPLDGKLKTLTGTGILRWAKRAYQQPGGPNTFQKAGLTVVGGILRRVMGIDKQLKDWKQSTTPVPHPVAAKSPIAAFDRAPLSVAAQGQPGPITLYGDKRSPHTLRTMAACHYLGLKFDLRAVDLARMEQKGGALMALNPNGELPAATIGSHTLYDSELIIDYLDRFSTDGATLIPRDAFEAAQMRMWIALEQGTHKEFRPLFYLHRIRPDLHGEVKSRAEAEARVPADAHPSFRQWIGDVYDGTHRFDTNETLAKAHIEMKLDRLETRLAGHDYLAGSSLSFADLAWHSRIANIADYGMALDQKRFINLIKWRDRIGAVLKQKS